MQMNVRWRSIAKRSYGALVLVYFGGWVTYMAVVHFNLYGLVALLISLLGFGDTLRKWALKE